MFFVFDDMQIVKIAEAIGEMAKDELNNLLQTDEWSLKLVLSESNKECAWVEKCGIPVYTEKFDSDLLKFLKYETDWSGYYKKNTDLGNPPENPNDECFKNLGMLEINFPCAMNLTQEQTDEIISSLKQLEVFEYFDISLVDSSNTN